MSPAARLNALLASATVTLMFIVITQLAPRVAQLAIRWQIASSLAALLTSAGIYRLLAVGIDWLLKRNTIVKKFVFGPHLCTGHGLGGSKATQTTSDSQSSTSNRISTES